MSAKASKSCMTARCLALLLLVSLAATNAADTKEDDDGDGDDDDDGLLGDLRRTIEDSDNDQEDVSLMSPSEIQATLAIIIEAIDSDDDDTVEQEEIHEWITASVKLLRDKETEEDFDQEDDDDDIFVTWSERVKKAYNIDDPDNVEDAIIEIVLKEEKELFDAADADDDDKLTLEEYYDFRQPDEDDLMLEILVKQTLDQQDQDKDGKLSKEEFVMFASGDEDNSEDEFEEQDEDDNEVLEDGEIKEWLKHDYSSEITEFILKLVVDVDDNNDGVLSVEEIVEEPETLQNSLLLDIGVQLQKRGLLPKAVGKDEL